MRLRRIMLIGLAFGLMIALGGCASMTGDSSSDTSSSDSSSTNAPPVVTVPASSRLAKIEIGMTEDQVIAKLGAPTNRRGYPTGKNWIPFYFGGDTHRMDYIYKGVGRVIFGNASRFSRVMNVVELLHNPQEP